VAVRSVLAALIAGSCLLAVRIPFPGRRHWPGLAVVAAGVVVGFPLLTTLALETSTTAHAAVVVGLLPLTTALFSALRTGTRPSRTFWTAALAGAAAVLVFTAQQSGGALTSADLYLFAALLVCAAGYTEGGRLARVMPGWQVIGWALVLCLPLSLPAARARAVVRARAADRAQRDRAALGRGRLSVPRPGRLVPGHGRHRHPQGQPVAVGSAPAHTGVVGAAAGRAPDGGRSADGCGGARVHRRHTAGAGLSGVPETGSNKRAAP
jgi:hypothetical protein